MCVLPLSFSAPCFGNQKQSTSLPDDFMQLGYRTNPKSVAQIMKYKVLCALHAVTSYYTCMKVETTLQVCINKFAVYICVELWNKVCYYVPVGYFVIGNLCSLVFVLYYIQT